MYNKHSSQPHYIICKGYWLGRGTDYHLFPYWLLLFRFLAFLQNCSLFYTKRFCLPCVQKNITEFPNEIQQVGRCYNFCHGWCSLCTCNCYFLTLLLKKVLAMFQNQQTHRTNRYELSENSIVLLTPQLWNLHHCQILNIVLTPNCFYICWPQKLNGI